MRFDGQVALVTGSGRGIGRAAAVKLGSLGAKVVINYQSNEQAARQVVDAIISAGGKAMAIRGDVSSHADADALVAAALSNYGRLDILVNNAGITRDTLVMRMSDADWEAVLDTNLKGAFFCVRAALRPMLKQRYGRIVNVSSVAGLAGNPGQANYSAAKAGLIGLTKATAREVASRNITVNAVAPGLIETDMAASISEAARVKIIEQIPVGRPGLADEVADAIIFLASQSAAYITGQVLAVDGGMVMA
ncbi:MAG: 3-oxoacyl-[acyl-carrier-protein] reductase [Chloroflexi bacterium]|nr:3-oxoacyl-[acyl-carrier-protein] reductase [Chloroflexota bacterium]